MEEEEIGETAAAQIERDIPGYDEAGKDTVHESEESKVSCSTTLKWGHSRTDGRTAN